LGVEPVVKVDGQVRDVSILQLAGMPVSRMSCAERGLVENLIGAYLGNMTKEVAERETARLRKAGWDALHFGWAGVTSPGNPHY
ncbi:MAG: DUF3500 domain-containing protein, partial [Rhodospirillaceae bacterium]